MRLQLSLLQTFREKFPDMDVAILNVDDPFDAYLDKEFWVPMISRFIHRVKDHDILSMVRVDCELGFSNDNIKLVPRFKAHCIELARCREGFNDAALLAKFTGDKKDFWSKEEIESGIGSVKEEGVDPAVALLEKKFTMNNTGSFSVIG